MRRFLKLIVFLVVAGAVALVVYAYFGDMSPDRQEQIVPLTLGGNG